MKNTAPHMRGFSLMELIVAIAVFSILSVILAALFASSTETIKTGYMTMQMNEEARVAFGVIERDLNSAFSARDYGDHFHFYGTPIGMTFVGAARSYEDKADLPNLGRITYVLHQSDDAMGFKRHKAEVLIPAEYGADTDGDGNVRGDADDVPEEWVPGYVYTCSLVRYYEPGTEDLDALPVDFEQLAVDPEFPNAYVEQELDSVASLEVLGWSPSVVQDVERAKKRQLWMRMISGLDPNLPSFFDNREFETNPFTDYVVADNIAFAFSRAEIPRAANGDFDPDGPDLSDGLFTEELVALLQLPENDNLYGYTLSGTDQPNDYPLDALYADPRTDFRLEGRPEVDPPEDVEYAAPIPFRFSYGVSDASRILLSPYWNADRNFPSVEPFTYEVSLDHSQQSGFYNVRDPYLNYPTDPEDLRWDELRTPGTSPFQPHPAWEMLPENAVNDPNLRSPLMAHLGTPLNPRLPELVSVTATLIGESPHTGAPNVRRSVDYTFDVPSGHMQTEPYRRQIAYNP
jgi:prepilin-type N-terminal cleavage/methylation domain-containing protein